MKILLLGNDKIQNNVQKNLEQLGHETDIMPKYDDSIENFDNESDIEYEARMKKRFFEISNKTKEADAILLLNEKNNITGSEYVAIFKGHIFMKDIYLYDVVDEYVSSRISAFRPTFINGNIEKIASYNQLQNQIIKHLEVDKMKVEEITSKLCLNKEMCLRELNRLVVRGAIYKSGTSYLLSSDRLISSKQKTFKMTRKY